jgi:hypothetical protein
MEGFKFDRIAQQSSFANICKYIIQYFHHIFFTIKTILYAFHCSIAFKVKLFKSLTLKPFSNKKYSKFSILKVLVQTFGKYFRFDHKIYLQLKNKYQ